MMKEGYRQLTISSVRRYSNLTDMSFSDSAVAIVANDDWLREHGVDPIEIGPGRKIYIKGRGPHGNKDFMLCRFDPLEDIQLASNCGVQVVDKRLKAKLLKKVVRFARRQRIVPKELVDKLHAAGLVRNSTSFRMNTLFPGEVRLFIYDFHAGCRMMGYLGLDQHSQLISIDERYPQGRKYLRTGTEWAEVQ